jgi:hypothetical protein
MRYWKQWHWARTKINNLLALGVSLKSAIQHGASSSSYWQMFRTPMINQAISNAWLKEQGLLSMKDLWCKAQGYTQKKGRLRRASRHIEPPTVDPHGGWCGDWELEAQATRLGRTQTLHPL